MIRIARTLRPARLRQTSQVFFGPGGEHGGRRAPAGVVVRAAHGGPCATAVPFPRLPLGPAPQHAPAPAPPCGPGAQMPGQRPGSRP